MRADRHTATHSAMRRDWKTASGIAATVTAGLLACRVPGMGSDSDAWSYAALGILSRKVGYFPSRLPGYPMYEYLAIALNRLHLPPTTLVGLSIASTVVCALLLWRIFQHYQVKVPWLIAPALVLTPAWAVGGSQAMEYSPAMAFLLGAWWAAIRANGWAGVLCGLAIGTRWTSIAGLPILWLLPRERRWPGLLSAAGIAVAMYLPTVFLWRWRNTWLPPEMEGGLDRVSDSALRGLGAVGLAGLLLGLAARPRVPAWPVVGAGALTAALFLFAPYEPEYVILPLPFLALIALYRRPEWAPVLLAVALLIGTPGAANRSRMISAWHSREAVRLLYSTRGYQVVPHWLMPRLVVLTHGTLRSRSARFVAVGKSPHPGTGYVTEKEAEAYRKANEQQNQPADDDE